MKILHVLALSTIAVTCVLTSCSKPKAFSSQQMPEDASKRLQAVVDEYFDSYLKLHPLFATAIGDHRFDDQLTISIGEVERKKEKELVRTSLEKAKKIPMDALKGQDRLTLEMFLQDLSTSLHLCDVDLDYLMPFNQFNSFFADFAELASGSSFVTFNTEIDYRNFLKRAKVVPAYIDTMIANMKEGIEKKVTTPKILVEKALKQLDALLVPDYTKSVFYQPVLTLEEKVGPAQGPALKKIYEEMIQKEIYPSYRRLQTFVQQEYLPKTRTTDGLEAIPGGKEFYLALVKGHTTTDLTPKQIQEMGYAEVKRIQKEMEDVKQLMGFKGDIASFFRFLKEKTPEFYPFHSSEEVMQAYWRIYDQVMKAVPKYFDLMPKAKFEIREVEKFKAENASEAYQPPSEDGSRPAIFWVPIPNPENYPVKDMECMFLHEAIPGHHFQISIQQELPHLCRYRKFMGNTAYIEGWALYAESLGKQLGMYTDPRQWIGRLAMEMHRAIRLVVDTGIHWNGWSREKAIEYSLEHEPEDLSSITAEIDRYMAIPGQAVSYKVGELRIQALKKRAQEALGTVYSEQQFHDQILQNGSLPLAVLETQINRWIQEKQGTHSN